MKVRALITSILPANLRHRLRYIHARLVVPAQLPLIEIGSFGGFEVAYRKGTVDEKVISKSFDNDRFFATVPEYQPSADHVIVDVGAHIGTFSLLAASKVPRGQVFAIEACRESYNLARINFALNAASNVEVTQLALADKSGVCTLHYSDENWGHSIIRSRYGGGERVSTDSLANFMTKNMIERCNFIKLNCEGSEFPILLNTPASLLNRVDVIVAAYHCDLYKTHSEQDLIEHLNASGFHTEIRNQKSQRGWIVALNTMTQMGSPKRSHLNVSTKDAHPSVSKTRGA